MISPARRSMFPALVLVALAACEAPEDQQRAEGDIIEPDFDEKADGLSGIDDQGLLGFGDEAAAEFTRDFQFFQYSFDARENAELSIEVTQLGSSQGLDTVMFLYRVHDDQSPSRIAFDDDDGFGALSKIDGFRLFSAGRYAIVVGTKGASGRGRFRLTLGCDSGECGPMVPADTACPSAMQTAIVDCMQEVSSEFSFEAPLLEVAEEVCGQPSELTVLLENACAVQSAPWCDEPTTVNACETFVFSSYPALPGVAMTPLDSPELDAMAEAVNSGPECGAFGEDAGCEFLADAFTYASDEPLAIETLIAHARTLSSPGPGVYPEQTTGEPAASGFVGFVESFAASAELEVALDALGLDLADAEFGTASGDEFQFAFGDCEGSLVVAHFPAARVVIDLNTLFCAG